MVLNRNLWQALVLVSTLLLWSLATATSSSAQSPELIRVMSFNIRYGTANDGINRWDLRKEFLVETIRNFDPDLLGTQETLASQRDYLAQALDGYGVVAAGRDDGKDGGEMAALFYRKDRFEPIEQGHIWLSETPEKVGSTQRSELIGFQTDFISQCAFGSQRANSQTRKLPTDPKGIVATGK
jgi:hypothetical protein